MNGETQNESRKENKQQRRSEVRRLKASLQLLPFVRGRCARLGGDQGGSKNHTDESEGDQNVMHPGFSLWGFSEPVHKSIIARK
jgi:hypothetical protein